MCMAVLQHFHMRLDYSSLLENALLVKSLHVVPVVYLDLTSAKTSINAKICSARAAKICQQGLQWYCVDARDTHHAVPYRIAHTIACSMLYCIWTDVKVQVLQASCLMIGLEMIVIDAYSCRDGHAGLQSNRLI